jgi:hypothetical protein
MLHLVVFVADADAAYAEIRVMVGDVTGATDENGSAELSVRPGTYSVTVTIPAALLKESDSERTVSVPDVPIVEGETTELLLNVSPKGELTSQTLETPRDSAQAEAREFEKAQAVKPKGKIAGTVVSDEKGTPIAKGRVFVRGAPVEAETDAAGRFELELPEGTYSISVIHPDYTTQGKDDIVVEGEKTSEVSVSLTPASIELPAYVITAPHVEGGVAALIAERRDTTAVADVIGAEQMSKSGDSDAASALKRVTGLTVVGGKFVYVRGMGERYSSTLLNGANLPSPEPERRVVPLDLFPAGVLGSVVVQKTYSPDMPGEFGGGVVQLRTRSYPDEFLFQVSTSVNYNTQTTFKNGLRYDGGKTDWLGVDDGTRALPGEVAEAGSGRRIERCGVFASDGECFTSEELEAFGEQFQREYSPHYRRSPADVGLTLTVGDSYQLGKDTKAGFVLSGLYGDQYDRRLRTRRNYAIEQGGGLRVKDDFVVEELTRTVGIANILDFGIDVGEEHQLRSTALLLRNTDDQAAVSSGFNDDLGSVTEKTRLRFVERQLITEQVRGHHVVSPLEKLEIDWRYAYSKAGRSEPDRREFRYDGPTRAMPVGRPFSNGRLFSDLDDRIHDVAFDVTLPFSPWAELDAKAKAGAMMVDRDREVATRRFNFSARGDLGGDRDLPRLAPEDLFSPALIGENMWQFQELTLPTDYYTAAQDIIAGYGLVEFPVTSSLDLMGGARIERSDQVVETFEPFQSDADVIIIGF